jgi:hypothetical protein
VVHEPDRPLGAQYLSPQPRTFAAFLQALLTWKSTLLEHVTLHQDFIHYIIVCRQAMHALAFAMALLSKATDHVLQQLGFDNGGALLLEMHDVVSK